MKKDYNRVTALYERLSKDDDLQGESNSISNQKEFLANFARTNGFTNLKHYTDDGYTGRNFNRPGFKEMLSDVENGKIGTIIVKDMSRFGRNYLQTGFYTEMVFPKKQVRFISITNNVDSESENPNQNDFTPFLNIMNEWYAKDTSNKIKTIFQSRMKDGKRCSGSIPYGYNRLPDDKQTLIIDPVASKVVLRIFELASKGNNSPQIAKILTKEKVLIPSAYTLQYHPEQCNMKAEIGNCEWNSNTVRTILNRQEYLGHTILRKSVGINFKTDERRSTTEDEQYFFENTHEPIISLELWEEAHKRMKRGVRRKANGEYNNECILAGFVFCNDCGKKMAYDVHYYKSGERYFGFRCPNYYTKSHSCTAHYVLEKNLKQLILHSIQRMTKKIIEDEEGFCNLLKKQWEEQKSEVPKESKKELIIAQKRYDELDGLIGGLYENYISGILPERQYKSLMIKYDTEQVELEEKIDRLQELLTEENVSKIDVKRFVSIIKKYKNPQELTKELVEELIDKIVVHEAVGKKPNREQEIDIYYNFIGQFELEYTEEEIAEANRKAEQEKKKKQEQKKKRQAERIKAYREKEKEKRWAENGGHKFAERICEHCGKPFFPNGNRQRYCSKECTYEAQQEARKQQSFAEKGPHTFKQKKCKICGKLFWPSNGREVLCSPECKAENQRQRQLAYYHNKKAKENEQCKNLSQTRTMELPMNLSEITTIPAPLPQKVQTLVSSAG